MEAIEDFITNASPKMSRLLAKKPSSPLHALITICGDQFPRVVAELDQVDAGSDSRESVAASDPLQCSFLSWLSGWVSIKNALLNALPEIYRVQVEDPSSPLQALIALAGDFLSHIVVELDQVDANFDSQRASAEPGSNGQSFLNWLAGWVLLDEELTWPEAKKRFLIQQAACLYYLRGTPQGLKALIELYFDIEIEIREWEWPKGLVIGCQSTLDVDTRLIDPSGGQSCFEARWQPRFKNLDDLDEEKLEQLTAMIRTVIDREKPAHTRCYFNVVRHEKPTVKLPNLVIDVTSTIGAFVIY